MSSSTLNNGASPQPNAEAIVEEYQEAFGRKLGAWGAWFSGISLLLLPVSALTVRWIAWPGYFLAVSAITLGIVGISITSRGYAGRSKKAALPEAAFGGGALFFVIAAALGYALGSPDTSKACSPYESCDAALEVLFEGFITEDELSAICSEWVELTPDDRADLTPDNRAAAEASVALAFNDPERAVDGVVEALPRALGERC